MGKVVTQLQRRILPQRNACIADVEGVHIDVFLPGVITIAVQLIPGIVADDG
ncbi:hypothetical protein D3C77_293540 [compost metagenome]